MKVLVLLLFFMFTGKQVQAQNGAVNNRHVKCVTAINFNNDSLVAVLKRYIDKVDTNEIPYIVRQTNADSTLYFVSAFIYTNSIVKNPPTAISALDGREVLYYDGTKQLGVDCQNALIKKYRRILHIDKLNSKYGVKPGSRQFYGSYDPICAKIIVIRDKVVDVTNTVPFRRVPTIEYRF